ncbi:MAG: Lrp/AsnC family transcriptional regulator [Rhodospirillaceae bacterium]
MALDAFDLKILAALQVNGGLSNLELAKKVGLSPSPCLRRVRALEEQGIIQGYQALIDRRAIGLGIRAFVELKLERQSEAATEKFIARVKRLPEVISCYLMTGSHDYLLDVVTVDMEAYSEFTTKKLISLPGVAEVRSGFVLKEISHRGSLPLDHLKAER